MRPANLERVVTESEAIAATDAASIRRSRIAGWCAIAGGLVGFLAAFPLAVVVWLSTLLAFSPTAQEEAERESEIWLWGCLALGVAGMTAVIWGLATVLSAHRRARSLSDLRQTTT